MMTIASARRVEWRDMRGSIARPRARKKAGRAQGGPAWEELLRTATQEDVGDVAELGHRRERRPDSAAHAGIRWFTEGNLGCGHLAPGCVVALRQHCVRVNEIFKKHLAVNQAVGVAFTSLRHGGA